MINEITYACIQWEQVCYSDTSKDIGNNLITEEYKSNYSQGLHKSARNAKYITSVFWLGLGWVMMDYELVKQIKEKFKLKVTLKKRKMDWIKR